MSLISIIIPCYNHERFIERCLTSIETQVFNNWECIIVDDGSTDKTQQIVQKKVEKDSRFKYFFQENAGVSAARNKGLELAQGDYFFFIDSDDYFLDDFSLNIFAERIHEGFDFISADILCTHDAQKPFRSRLTKKQKKDTVFSENVFDAMIENYISRVVWNKLYDKNFIERNQLRFKNLTNQEDLLWIFECSFFAKKALFINKITYCYYQDTPNSLSKGFNEVHFENIKKAMKYIAQFIKEKELYGIPNALELSSFFYKICASVLYQKNVLKNKKWWVELYLLFKKEYHHAKLDKLQKRFTLQAELSYAYFLTKKLYWKIYHPIFDRKKFYK